jgi:hypothetical protein
LNLPFVYGQKRGGDIVVDHSVDFFGGVFPKRITKEVMHKYFDFYDIKKEAEKLKVIKDFRSRGYSVENITLKKRY